jgi:hypothetical protein
VSDDCPADVVATAGTECRAAAGVCDVAETCDGTSNVCPADVLASSATVCRPTAGSCDVAENCTGSDVDCPADAFQPSSVTCRPSAGDCDVPESCTGSSGACPNDSVLGAFVLCRPAAGPCDPPETCDGTNPTCPADAFVPSNVTCRPSAGVCDIADHCPGTGAACPPDAKSTAVCRPSAGSCDVAESCNGTSDTCPADAFAPTGASCRAAAGTCDVAEVCTGLTGTCPPDISLPNGTPCDDLNTCTTPDTCQGGTCTGTPSPGTCADHFLCYKAKIRGFTPIPSVSLADEFESVTASLVKARHLCTPADKNGEGINDPNTHLETYSARQTTAHVRQTVLTTNQFPAISLTTTKPDLLFVPTAKSLVASPPPPDDNLHDVDHYKCYKVKVTSGTPKFPKGVTATIADQFNAPPKLFDVRKPKHFCTPVDKNGEGIKNSDAHLICYQVKGVKGQPKHVRQNVFLNNQLGATTGTTLKESELCVPTVVNP